METSFIPRTGQHNNAYLHSTATHEDVDAPTSHGRRHTIGTLPRQHAEPSPAPENQPTAAPLGYNILVSKTCSVLPASWHSHQQLTISKRLTCLMIVPLLAS